MILNSSWKPPIILVVKEWKRMSLGYIEEMPGGNSEGGLLCSQEPPVYFFIFVKAERHLDQERQMTVITKFSTLET